MRISNIKQKNSQLKSLSKKRYVLFNERNQKMKEMESISKERFNTINIISDSRNTSKNRLNKKEKENYFSNLSKKKEILLKINPEKNDKESYPYNIIKKKINKSKENKTYKDYPNNIKGVLGQAKYNNETNNANYNDFIRYKPLIDIFTEQSNIPSRKITTENNNSLNLSFNSKSDFIKKNDLDNNNILNNYNIENELKINADSIKSRKNETLIKSGKCISPILSNYNNNENKKETNNDIVSEYNIKTIEKKEKKNNNEINNRINKELNNVEIYSKKKEIKKEEIKKESFNFAILNQNKKKLIFNNDEEIWKYLKNKKAIEKEEEYNDNKLKYDYFTLIKKFHGKILYEIGLENNINEINNILQKENVKVENEHVLLIKQSIFENLKNNVLSSNENENNLIKNKNDKLIKENEILQNNINLMKKEIDKLNQNIKSLEEKLIENKNELEKKQIIINNNETQLEELNIQIKNRENAIKEFNLNDLDIIKNNFFDLIQPANAKIKNNDIIYIIENFRHEYKNVKIKKGENKINKDKIKDKNSEIKLNKIEIKDNKKEVKDDKKEIKEKINIFNNNNSNQDNSKKEENIPNKIFLLNNEKKEETLEEKKRREERMNKALKRIKNKRKLDEEKDKLKKSENIYKISNELETKLKNDEGKKLYVDLEYEKELEEEKEENRENY